MGPAEINSKNACLEFLARDAFLRTNRRAIAMMFVRPSVCPFVCLSARLSGMDVHCDHMVHFSADLSLCMVG